MRTDKMWTSAEYDELHDFLLKDETFQVLKFSDKKDMQQPMGEKKRKEIKIMNAFL